jgi:hypothetical protein
VVRSGGFGLFLLLLGSGGQSIEDSLGGKSIEDSLGGIEIGGKSNISDLRKRFKFDPPSPDDSIQLVTVPTSDSCDFIFTMESDGTFSSGTLEAKKNGTDLSSRCRAVATGAGLKIGDSLKRLRKLYGHASRVLPEDDGGAVFVFHNLKGLCKNKQPEAVVTVRDFRVFLTRLERVWKMVVSQEEITCEQYEESMKSP